MRAQPRSLKSKTALQLRGGFSIGLTGGIASGKSAAAKEILARLDIEYCDVDRIVHEFLENDPQTREEVLEHFSESILDSSKKINRIALGKIVFASAEKRRILESILHPKVRTEWMRLLGAAKERSGSILVEIPLLFEKGYETQFDTVVLVACSAKTQLQRMTNTRGIPLEKAKAMMAAQMTTHEKLSKANHIIWNDGEFSCMSAQADYLLTKLLPYA
ncbi:MAG: dephospho-CoA kinase [Chthoniobacterales bacterium]